MVMNNKCGENNGVNNMKIMIMKIINNNNNNNENNE
jgi:hypothetical protein